MNKIRALGWMLVLAAFSLTCMGGPGPQKQSAPTMTSAGKAPSDVPEINDVNMPAGEMRDMLERYAVDRLGLGRSFPVEHSAARRGRMKQFYSQWREALPVLNFDAMSLGGQVDYILFRNHLEHELWQLETQARQLAEVEALIPFAQVITDLEETRRRMEPIEPRKAATLLTDLGKKIEATRAAVETGMRPDSRPRSPAETKVEPVKVKKTVANRAVGILNNYRGTLRNWFSFYNGYDPVFTWWVDAPYAAVDKSLQDYMSFLRERLLGLKPLESAAGALIGGGSQFGGRGAGGQAAPGQVPAGAGGRGMRGASQAEPGSTADIIGDPIGRDALMAELAHEMIPYTPEELIAIANRELAWCESEMKKASRELGFGEDWQKALEHVKTLYVEPGKQPQLILDLALEAIRFLEDRDLLTIPPLARDSWRMEMMSPERQLVNPFFTGGEIISVSYPTNTMSHEQKMMSMRGNNIHFSRATVFHELIPGHHLQLFMSSRYRTYRSIFGTPFSTEGWALYWELFFWDMNFPKTPENRIGMLFWRMHRCARIIFSLSFHLDKMTPQECVDFLVKRVGHERENAIGEVRRSFDGSYGPLYQAAYLLGGLQIYSLRKEIVDSGKMTNRAFHDAILRENRIPIEMLRAVLARQKLGRDFASSWKFYGPAPAGP